ncbi:MAG: type I-C CRISPR-associated endonuclease Cas1 [Magnetococcales bacterium]|nr:type I-C CRISPR-associated endonuclease Cas1 [Magnetococcales bacterium]MBF0115518.1 type I-C CRISPR-associated endonuclease Cas1 [Magnetococcales bacterium]
MRHHLNTLFVTLEGAWLRKQGEAVDVRLDGETKLRVPLHNLEGIVCLGWDIGASSQLMAACAEGGITLSFCTPYGQFLAASTGFARGNVLLRREQYRRADRDDSTLAIARNCVAAKVANSRVSLQRARRDRPETVGDAALARTVDILGRALGMITQAATLDELRGYEGEAAHGYFEVLGYLLTTEEEGMTFSGRSRRPPRDAVNALMSFLYALLAHDCRSALEASGLDAAVGFLHRDRPGRPSLALDLMEEFRPVLADRLTLSLLNRKQLTLRDFETRENGAVLLRDESRKKVLVAWQERKKEELIHPFLGERITLGLLPHLQARLLARHLRGDMDAYPAFLWK